MYFINTYVDHNIFKTCTKDVIVICFSRSQLFNLQKKVNSPAEATGLAAIKASNKTPIP